MTMIEVFYLFATLFVVALGGIAIKVGFSFDLNKFMDQRRKRRKERLRVLCPHAIPDIKDGQVGIRPLMTSPSGTHDWICGRCGLRTHNGDMVDQQLRQFAENPKLLMDRETRFQKSAKKFYGV